MTDTPELISQQNVEVLTAQNINPDSEWGRGKTLYISSEILGTNLWETLVKETQTDGKERGFVNSWKGKKITSSKIIVGEKDITFPVFPQGIKSFLFDYKDLVTVHTHFMPPSADHVATTSFSNKDLRTFAKSVYKAAVVIDRGGAHLLVRKPYFQIPNQIETIDITNKAFEKAKTGNNSIAEVMAEIGNIIEPLGMKYYYSPHLTPESGDFMTFNDVTISQNETAVNS